LDEALTQEGWARELISRVQRARKESGLAVVDRIELVLETADDELSAALMGQVDYISAEVLATKIRLGSVVASAATVEIDGRSVALEVQRVEA
jgi:isoleucyl-tRNA synthetase